MQTSKQLTAILNSIQASEGGRIVTYNGKRYVLIQDNDEARWVETTFSDAPSIMHDAPILPPQGVEEEPDETKADTGGKNRNKGGSGKESPESVS